MNIIAWFKKFFSGKRTKSTGPGSGVVVHGNNSGNIVNTYTPRLPSRSMNPEVRKSMIEEAGRKAMKRRTPMELARGNSQASTNHKPSANSSSY